MNEAVNGQTGRDWFAARVERLPTVTEESPCPQHFAERG
jgi:hypothetical protein